MGETPSQAEEGRMQAAQEPAEEGVEELDPLRVIEAALFMSSKPLSLDELSRLIGIAAIGYVEELVKKLQKEYEERGSAICISREGGAFIMRVKGAFAQKVGALAKEAEISPGALKILAFVSQNEGTTQSHAVKLLGSTVYQYVKELVQNGFITAERRGRTRVLKTTSKFRDYFSG